MHWTLLPFIITECPNHRALVLLYKAHGPNHAPIIWTLSEPYGAQDWWPCKNTLTDKADSIDTYIAIPSGNKPRMGLKEITPNGTNYTYHWKHRHPIAAYLVAQAVTNYSTFLDTAKVQHGSLPVLYYTYPEDSASARSTDGQLLQVIHYYDSLFIPYAFNMKNTGMPNLVGVEVWNINDEFCGRISHLFIST